MDNPLRIIKTLTPGRGLLLVAVVIVLALGTLVPAEAHQYGGEKYTDNHPSDDYYWPGSSYNGFKIYLSPAHHWQGWKYGCDGYIEDFSMRTVADSAADDVAFDLVDRGFYARVGQGDPDDAVRRSNAWPSNRHISIHSNGSTQDGTDCAGAVGGTIVYNYPGSSQGDDLGQELLNRLAPESPGSGTDYDDTATFYELANTSMPAAYIETGFHDYDPDQNWLTAEDDDYIPYLISLSVDEHLGYP